MHMRYLALTRQLLDFCTPSSVVSSMCTNPQCTFGLMRLHTQTLLAVEEVLDPLTLRLKQRTGICIHSAALISMQLYLHVKVF